MSPKQEIYQNILRNSLPYFRNMSNQSRFRRFTDNSLPYETEFIHDLYLSLFEPDFTNHDLWIMNVHAKHYVESCDSKKSFIYDQQVQQIRKLFEIFPDDRRSELKWNGPK